MVIERNAAFVRDQQSRLPLTPHFRHRETITSATFSGRTPGRNDQHRCTARVWDAQTGEPLRPRWSIPGPCSKRRFVPTATCWPRSFTWRREFGFGTWRQTRRCDLVALSQLLSGSDLDQMAVSSPSRGRVEQPLASLARSVSRGFQRHPPTAGRVAIQTSRRAASTGFTGRGKNVSRPGKRSGIPGPASHV